MAHAWDVTRGSRNVIVAVVDTGVNPRIRDLRGGLVPGRDFVSGGFTNVDTDGHGTLVASIIAARGNNGTGVPGYCWSCRVMPVRVADGISSRPPWRRRGSGGRWITERKSSRSASAPIPLAAPT